MNEMMYRCPYCRKNFRVGEDSNEYLVPCPHCGQELDLTELEWKVQSPELSGIVIEETITEIRPGTESDPAAKAIQNAIDGASMVAGNVAAAGLRTFRKIQDSFFQKKASSEESTRPTTPGSRPALGVAFAPAHADPVEAAAMKEKNAKSPTYAGYAEARAAFAEQRFAEVIAIFRRAAAKGDRDAMLALSGCLLKGLGGRPDLLSARLWQSRAKATVAEVEAVLRALYPNN